MQLITEQPEKKKDLSRQEYAQLLHERLLRTCRTDPSQFLQYVVSWGIPDWKPLSDMHIRWQHTLTEGGNRILIMTPRNHSKTTYVPIGRILWELGNNPDLRVKIICQNDDTAIKRLAAITDHIERNPRLKEVFPDLKPADKGTWSKTRVYVQRQIISPDPSIEALGILSTAVGGRSDILVFDDPVDFRNAIQQPALRSTVKEAYDNVWMNIPEPNSRVWYIACLTGDTQILMKDGTVKLITDVKTGDEVWSLKESSLETAKVINMIPQPESQIYELRTQRYSIKATSTHPFLTVGEEGLIWKTLANLKPNDFLLSCKFVDVQEQPKHFPATRKRNQKHPMINGKLLNEEFMWLLGFLFGDGWAGIGTKKNGSYIAWAESMYPELNEKALQIAETWFGKAKYHNRQQFIWNRPGARGIIELGLHGGAKGKRLAPWVFQQSAEMKIAFIKGLLDADGYKTSEKNHILKLSNEGLIWDVKNLAMTCGVRASYPYYGERVVQAPHSKFPLISRSWQIHIQFRQEEIEWNFRTKQCQHITPLNLQTRTEKVLEINKLGIEKVYDLQIKETHNFIANGLITHNTPWHTDDLSQKLSKDPLYVKIEDKIDDNYTSIWPEKWSSEELRAKEQEIGIRAFARAFKMKALSDDETLFSESAITGCIEKGLKYGSLPNYNQPPKYFMGIDLGGARSLTGSYTVIFTGAVLDNKKIPVSIIRGRFKSPEFAHLFFETLQQYKPELAYIENNSSQEAVVQWVKEIYGREVRLPVEGYFTGNQKMDDIVGLPSMAVEFEQRSWKLPELHPDSCTCGYCTWIHELREFPLGKYSDTVMASWLFREAVRRMTVRTPRIFSLSSLSRKQNIFSFLEQDEDDYDEDI